jgi:hypothetical protein
MRNPKNSDFDDVSNRFIVVRSAWPVFEIDFNKARTYLEDIVFVLEPTTKVQTRPIINIYRQTVNHL